MRNNKFIAIYGQYKTGTTGLFYKIKNSLPPDIRTIFEHHEYVELPEDKNNTILLIISLLHNTYDLKQILKTISLQLNFS